MNTFRPPWRAPPPDLYKLKPVLGYKNHDITKKKAPAWSFVRYIPFPKPKPVVSMSPFQLKLLKSKRVKNKRKLERGYGLDNASGDYYSRKGFNSRRKTTKKKKAHNIERIPHSEEKPVYNLATKDKSKKALNRMSDESGRFVISPEDMCDLCFPWASKTRKDKCEESDMKSRKSRRSRSISGTQQDEADVNTHSFVTIHGKRPAEECEPHSAVLLPSGRKVAVKLAMPKLPQPPDDKSESSKSPSPKKKKSSKSSAKT